MNFFNLLIARKEDNFKIQASNTGYFKGKITKPCYDKDCNHFESSCKSTIHGYGTLIALNDTKFNAHWIYGEKQ